MLLTNKFIVFLYKFFNGRFLRKWVPLVGDRLFFKFKKSKLRLKLMDFLGRDFSNREFHISLRLKKDSNLIQRKALKDEVIKPIEAENFTSQDEGYGLFSHRDLPLVNDVVKECENIIFSKVDSLKDLASYKYDERFNNNNKGGYFYNILSPEELISHPTLMDFALHPKVVSNLMMRDSFLPQLTSIGIKVSVPNNDVVGSQHFHFDPLVNSRKLFLNIFDVSEENGPFSFLPKTHREEILSQMKPGERSQAQPSKETLKESLIRVTGNRGDGLICDTSLCYHYGSRVDSGVRIILLVFYSDYMNYNWFPSKSLFNDIWLKDHPQIREHFSTDEFRSQLLRHDFFG